MTLQRVTGKQPEKELWVQWNTMQRGKDPPSSLWARKARSINKSNRAIKASLPDSGTGRLGQSLESIFVFAETPPRPLLPVQLLLVSPSPSGLREHWDWALTPLRCLVLDQHPAGSALRPTWLSATCHGHQPPARTLPHLPGWPRNCWLTQPRLLHLLTGVLQWQTSPLRKIC